MNSSIESLPNIVARSEEITFDVISSRLSPFVKLIDISAAVMMNTVEESTIMEKRIIFLRFILIFILSSAQTVSSGGNCVSPGLFPVASDSHTDGSETVSEELTVDAAEVSSGTADVDGSSGGEIVGAGVMLLSLIFNLLFMQVLPICISYAAAGV